MQAFAKFAEVAGDTHVRAGRALEWASMASTPIMRGVQLRTVAKFAAFLRAEDPARTAFDSLFPTMRQRQAPYIYSPSEVVKLVEAAGRLRRTHPLKSETYATLLGLIASTGLRISEALDLTFDDLEPGGGTIVVRSGKFGKAPARPAGTRRWPRRLAATPTSAASLGVLTSTCSFPRVGVALGAAWPITHSAPLPACRH